MNPAVIPADLWNMHVQQLHPLTPTWKWPPPPLPPTPPPPPPPPLAAAAAAPDHHDDREKFRRKFALAALKAGVPVPGHLSPEGGRCYDDIMMVPGVGMGHYDDTALMGAGDGYFSGTYFGQEMPTVQTVAGVQSVQVQAVRQRWRCAVEGCTKRFKSKQALKYHNETGHGKNDRECSGCGKVCKGDKNHRKHVAKCLPRN